MNGALSMKKSKILLPIVLIVILAFSWFVRLNGTIKNLTAYGECISAAEESKNDGLYEQAIEFYNDSLKYRNSKNTYVKIKDTYALFYEEEHTAFVRNHFIEDMEKATEKYPKSADLWISTANLYLDALNYSSAYK